MGYNKYTFWQILKEKRIIIPIIQRDYAQGRDGQEYVRKSFLEQLGKAIFNKEQTELDFVYGTEKENIMYPLDGQQRLTTLWLLHWYLAYKTGRLHDVKETLKKFSYQTRTSSREFCKQLCELEYSTNGSIVKHIKNQTWFFSAWKQDPTIQAMLRMLSGTNLKSNDGNDFIDGIEELFKDKICLEDYWSVLTQEDCPIKFNYLPLESNELPVSDDLYIKMNARGKALTSFENFKAHFIGWMKNSQNPESDKFQEHTTYDGREVPYYLAFSNKIDNEWTDIFWANGKMLGRVDEIYFAFINRYFYNLVITKDGIKDDNSSNNTFYTYFSDIKNPKDNDKKIAYTTFDFYSHFLNLDEINNFSTIMNNFYSSSKKCNNLHELLVCSWNQDFRFVPEFCKDDEQWKKIVDNAGNKIYEVTTINQMERVVFYAICKYFKAGQIPDDGTSLNRWMRFVWNLVSDCDSNNTPSIRSIGAMQAAISLIDKIQNPLDIYGELKNKKEESSKSEINIRFNEEIKKARQILDKESDANVIGPNEAQIIKAENHAFFRGSIRFLFTDENGNMNDWGNFDRKFENAKKYFNEEGLTEYAQKDALTNRILLSYCNDWDQQIQSCSHNDKFLFSYSIATWRNNILMRTNVYAKPIHNLLMGNGLCNSISLVNSDSYRAIAFDRIVNTDLIAKINTGSFGNRDKYYIRWIYDGLSLYPSSKGFILTLNNRDKFLNELIKDDSITIIDGILVDTHPIKIFFGWDISFVFKNNNPNNKYTFKWQHWNWIDMYVDGEIAIKDPSTKEKWTINGSQILDLNDIKTKLNHCIEEYERVYQNGTEI